MDPSALDPALSGAIDPERQFRKYLQWDGESAWKIQRLEPLGLDKDGNKYFHLADDRLWIQRRAPSAASANSSAAPSPSALADGQYGQQAIKKPKTLLGLKAGPRDKSKKGTVTGTIRVKLKKDKITGKFSQVTEEDELAVNGNGEGDEDEEDKPQTEIEEVEMPVWEREYWEERLRAENTPGFVEWEAVCVSLDDWRAFPHRFAHSTDPNEIRLREKIALEVVPGIEEDLAQRRETERLEAEARLANEESAAEAESRQAVERLVNAERFSRSTRHARPQSYAEDQFGVAAVTRSSAAGGASGSGDSPALEQGESREERLRKREEEKRRAEEADAARQAQEAWELEREQARQANGGVLPVELMTAEERAEYEKAVEKERKKREAEEKKKSQEDKKQKARAKERRAELKAERDAIEAEERAAEEAAAQQAAQRAQANQYAAMLPDPSLGGAVDDPWWMDCEICGLAGWNVDDGQELICCDECEEWQHLPCHQHQDLVNGNAPQPFHDEDYKWACGRCLGSVPRTQRPPLPNPPNAQLQVPSAAQSSKRRASDANGRGGSSKGSKKPKTSKPEPQQQAAADPQAPMSYDQLKEMVQTNPALLGQLPPDYQVHFSQLLGIPLP